MSSAVVYPEDNIFFLLIRVYSMFKYPKLTIYEAVEYRRIIMFSF